MLTLNDACSELNRAAARMHEAEHKEAEAVARLSSVDHKTPVEEIDSIMEAANEAIAARVQSQIHYSNCRAQVRIAWEMRGGK